MQLMEAVTWTLQRILEEGLPDKLAQIEIESNDGLPLKKPERYINFEPSDLAEISADPCVAVLPGDTIVQADTGYSGPGGSGWMDATHEAGVMISCQDTDPSILTTRLLRYQRAIIEVVGANRVGPLDRDGLQAWSGINIDRTAMGNRFYPNNAEVNAYKDYCVVIVRATRSEG
jgi:hypothetical protein